MIINTRDFGEVEIEQGDVITFPSPVFGFESLTKYVFLFDDELGDHFVWLQSVEDSEVCFILMSPEKVVSDYQVDVEPAIADMLGDGDVMAWVIVVIKDDFADSTVNLRAPILVNPEKGVAIQAVLDNDYPVRHPIFAKQGE